MGSWARLLDFCRQSCLGDWVAFAPSLSVNNRRRRSLVRSHGQNPQSARSSTRRAGLERLETRDLMAADASSFPEALSRFGSIDEVKDFLVDKALDQYASQFGQPLFYYHYLDDGLVAWRDTPQLFQAGSTNDSLAANHSTTNTQVEGVDEADLIETDGEYLYVLRDGELTITDAGPLEVTARVELTGIAVGEYLSGDRLTVITTQYHGWGVDPLFGRFAMDALPFSPSVISKPSVTVTVLDVSNPAQPQLVEETKLDGNYVTSRAIGDKVFVIVGNSDLSLPPPIVVCPEMKESGGEVEGTEIGGVDSSSGERLAANSLVIDPEFRPRDYSDCRYEDREAYLTRINEKLDSILEGLLPQYSSWDENGEFVRGGNLHEPADIVRPFDSVTSQLLSVVSFDVFDDQTGPVAAEAIPTTWTSTLYASQDSLYVFQPRYDGWLGDNTTMVVAFDWDVASGAIHVAATGEVPGTPLNQFSIDEFEGRLRIATSIREFDEFQFVSSSGVFVLERVGSTLSVVGSVTGIAPGETIRAVRFAGDQGYVVTFRQIDPFFTLDLSDPKAPTVVGELKIPGYSGYLHVLDETHVVGLGRVPGDEPWQWNLQVSLFDVSDPALPIRLGAYTFADDVWGSNAEQDHLAFLWMPDLHMLAMPIHSPAVVPLIWNPDAPEVEHLSGLALLKLGLDPDQSALPPIALESIIPQPGTRRGVRIGDLIYAISATEVKSVLVDSPNEVVATLDLGSPPPMFVDIDYELQNALWFSRELPLGINPEVLVDPGIEYRSTPSPWDDLELSDLLHEATSKLATQLGIAPDDIRLVTVESLATDGNAAGTRVLNLVLAVGEQKYLFTTTDGESEFELVDEGYEFPDEPLTREWHNESQPCDIDGDGIIAPIDGLIVVNELNDKGPKSLRSDRPLRSVNVESRPRFAIASPPRYRFDSSGDGLMSPLDALLIINELNGESEGATGEGEATSATDVGSSISVMAAWKLSIPTAPSSSVEANPESVLEIVSAASADPSGAFQDAALQELGVNSLEGSMLADDTTLAHDFSLAAEGALGCAHVDSLFAAEL